MPVLHVEVRKKKATFLRRDGDVVCGNGDYSVHFTFDEDWDDVTEKTARFVWSGGYQDVPFSGNTCTVPVVNGAESMLLGIMTSGPRVMSTTPATIPCVPCVLDVECTRRE